MCKLTNLWDDPQWRLTSLGCWKVSVQTWFCTTQALTLIRKMSSGGFTLLTKVRDDFEDTKSTYKVLTGLSTYKNLFFLSLIAITRTVSERSVRDEGCGEQRCSCRHGYWRRILKRHQQTGPQTLHCSQSSYSGMGS